MEEFGLIKDIWKEGHKNKISNTSIKKSFNSRLVKNDSILIAEKIVYKKKIEWVMSWLLLLSVSITLGMLCGFWGVIFIFTLPFIFSFLEYRRRTELVNSFDFMNTLDYLKSMNRFIYKSNEEQVKLTIIIFIPFCFLMGYFLGFSFTLDREGFHWQSLLEIKKATIVTLTICVTALSVIGFIFTTFAPNYIYHWVEKIYGKEHFEIKEMIRSIEN